MKQTQLRKLKTAPTGAHSMHACKLDVMHESVQAKNGPKLQVHTYAKVQSTPSAGTLKPWGAWGCLQDRGCLQGWG